MTDLTFKKLLSGVAEGEVVIPVIRAALWNPSFKSFSVEVRGFEARPPDGWFHPSTHPLWTERQLYYYLTNPGQQQEELFDPHSTMAVTQGHFWHSLIGTVGREAGLFTGVEVSVKDERTGSRGSMDATLATEVFEFKTMGAGRFSKIEKGAPDDPTVVAIYRKMAPDYFAQAQEYMRMSGYARHRTLILSMAYPFPMREIVLDFDRPFAYEVAEKFVRVRQAVADGRPPPPCCAPLSKESRECPARGVCPVALMAS